MRPRRGVIPRAPVAPVAPVAIVALLGAAGAASCGPPPTDVFTALAAIPGGALLSTWVNREGTRAYLVGGLVGVDPAMAPDRSAIGRLVRYENGRFETVCRSPSVLWWVHAVDNVVFASGENGTVLRFEEGRGCTQIQLGLDFPMGAPTLWGAFARSPTDVVFVGGSAAPDGTKGVLLEYDGTTFRRATIPARAQSENLFKVAAVGDATLVVGARGIVLRRATGSNSWVEESVPPLGGDDTIFTVSCASAGERCIAVGGVGVGRVLHRSAAGAWTLDPISDEIPGMSGVWVHRADRAFVVGNNGTTLAYAGASFYRPPSTVTRDALHAVHGASAGSLVIAVGGEMLDPRPTQRATILLRGVDRREFTFDGAPLRATGAARPEL
jgi:hypothetical protein